MSKYYQKKISKSPRTITTNQTKDLIHTFNQDNDDNINEILVIQSANVSLRESLSLKDNDMFLTATRGNIVDFTIEPVSKVIGASTDVVLTWKCGNTVPSGSFF